MDCPSRKGQSMLETAVLVVAIAVAVSVFFTFIKAAVSSRVKGGADAFGHGLLY